MNLSPPSDVPIEIDVQSVKALLDSQQDLLLLDCREDKEYAHVHIDGAIQIPMGQIPERVGELEAHRARPVVVHCHHGGRSLRVTHWLRSQGFTNVRNMTGGIDAWSLQIDPRYPGINALMSEPLAFVNGKLVPAATVGIPLDDAGFLLGTTIPEQLRTFRGRLFRLDQHLARLFRGLSIVGVTIPYTREQLEQAALELVAHNHALLAADDDLGLTILVTPGPLTPQPGRGPLVIMHTRPVPFGSFAPLYTHGQNLVTTSVRQVPSDCWPPELKCRSRMHYWLADHEAQRQDPTARAIMLDHSDSVLEASTANILIYDAQAGLLSPPQEKILPGISVATLAELAGQLGIPYAHRELTVADVASANELLLCSTTPCVWPVLKFNGQPIGTGAPGDVFQRLIAAWSEHVGVDIVAQAQAPGWIARYNGLVGQTFLSAVLNKTDKNVRPT